MALLSQDSADIFIVVIAIYYELKLATVDANITESLERRILLMKSEDS
ncbi:hypothetical protein [Okeania sp. SIO2B3]|nr:hypothetical protein [Okeania sp. SIO2B3]NET46399.1 hypothetical protein [Okeania sp. SIO2B3]